MFKLKFVIGKVKKKCGKKKKKGNMLFTSISVCKSFFKTYKYKTTKKIRYGLCGLVKENCQISPVNYFGFQENGKKNTIFYITVMQSVKIRKNDFFLKDVKCMLSSSF